MTKTLEELGRDYMDEIDLIEEKIGRYRKRLKRAFEESNSDEIFNVQRLLSVFYREKCELIQTARTLLNYYS